MDEHQWLAERFEEQRPHLRSVAYRMLGSLSEAEDAVQDAWLRLSRADVSDVENLQAWLTTVVARLCLNMLRSRQTRREDSLEIHLPDPLVTRAEGGNPEQQAVLADSVGLALFVVLETLAPDERLAFVLHDMFGVPFDEIAPMVDRTPAAARQLASRARRRLRGKAPTPDRDLTEQRKVVDAFFAAAHQGNFEALVSVLDPEVVLRSDVGDARIPGSRFVRGAHQVASQALMFSQPNVELQPVLINGAAGVVVYSGERVFSLLAFTVVGGKVAEINAIADPERLRKMKLPPRDA
ncbi:MAG: RNA polymerase sigma factor SigJ [Nitrolancea sp.]